MTYIVLFCVKRKIVLVINFIYSKSRSPNSINIPFRQYLYIIICSSTYICLPSLLKEIRNRYIFYYFSYLNILCNRREQNVNWVKMSE